MAEPNDLVREMTGGGGSGRRLNHVEFAHRPGEGELAVTLFEALGCSCKVIDTEEYGAYIVVSLDGSPHGENDMFASLAEPDQLALEEQLQQQIADGGELAARACDYRKLQQDRAFRATHIGMRIPDVEALNAVIDRLDELVAGRLAGRLELGYTMERSLKEARATDSPIKQIWIWTDVISTGLLTFGQQFELQAYD